MLKNEDGFSLLELMISVGIIGCLASIAIPNYQHMVHKAMQVEAKLSLSAYSTAQNSYYAEYGTYNGAWDAIGFQLTGPQRYSITVQIFLPVAMPGTVPQGTATCNMNCFAGGNPIAAADCPAGYTTWTCENSAFMHFPSGTNVNPAFQFMFNAVAMADFDFGVTPPDWLTFTGIGGNKPIISWVQNGL